MRSTPDGPISKVIGIGFLLLLPAGLGVLSIPIYLGATLLFVSWVMSRTKARPRTPFQTTRPTALSADARHFSTNTHRTQPTSRWLTNRRGTEIELRGSIREDR